jgi:hypothetical protein
MNAIRLNPPQSPQSPFFKGGGLCGAVLLITDSLLARRANYRPTVPLLARLSENKSACPYTYAYPYSYTEFRA